MLTTGIDKIWITQQEGFDTKEAKMRETSGFDWVGTGEFIADEETGELVERKEKKSFFKKSMNDISGTGMSIDQNEHGLLLKANPNRILSGNHHSISPQDKLEQFAERAGKILTANKIHGVDLMNSKLTWLDLCKQAQLDYEIEAYAPAFASLGLNRLKGERAEHGYYFRNDTGNSEAVFYNKSLQVKSKFKEIIPPNLARFETRWMNGKTIKASLKTDTLNGLMQINCNDAINKYAVKRIFNGGVQLSINPAKDSLINYLMRYTNKKGFPTGKGLDEFLNDYLLYHNGNVISKVTALMELYGSYEALYHDAVKVGGMDRTVFHRHWKKWKQQDEFYQVAMVRRGLKPIDLIAEIKDRFELVA